MDLSAIVGRVRAVSNLPIAVGFGIASPAQVAQVCQVADGAVVGSALVDKAKTQSPAELGRFVRSLKAATNLNGSK
jgi:tryptophan synthase alpha chain